MRRRRRRTEIEEEDAEEEQEDGDSIALKSRAGFGLQALRGTHLLMDPIVQIYTRLLNALEAWLLSLVLPKPYTIRTSKFQCYSVVNMTKTFIIIRCLTTSLWL